MVKLAGADLGAQNRGVHCRGRLGLLCLAVTLAGGCGADAPSSPDADPIGEEPPVTGGAGGDTCRVASLLEEGSGTLYDCIVSQQGPRTIVFDVSGVLSLPRNTYVQDNTTIDATAAGGSGITLRMSSDRRRALILEGPVTNVVIRGLRFEGGYGAPDAVEYDLLALDGEDGVVSNVLVERCTFQGATDGALDITGAVRDAVVRWNLFYGNPQTMLIRYGVRERLSLHRNVFAENGERNPQIRGDVRTIDFVNNVVYDWKVTPDGYGTEIRNDPGGSVSGNFVNNAFLAMNPATDGPGFTLYNYEGARPGQIWTSGNVCSPPCDVPSTVAGPLPAPLRVTPWPVDEFSNRLLPVVGAPARSARDLSVLARVEAALEGRR